MRRAANTSASTYQNLLPTYVVIALMYIAVNLALGKLSNVLEKRLRTRKGGGGKQVQIVETGGESDLLARQSVMVVDVPGIDEFKK